MRRKEGGSEHQRLIAATEIACWVYCPEQWRLEYGLGLPASNQAVKKAGTRHHRRKAVAEWLAGGAIAFGRLIAVSGFAVLLWLGWRSR